MLTFPFLQGSGLHAALTFITGQLASIEHRCIEFNLSRRPQELQCRRRENHRLALVALTMPPMALRVGLAL